jgi:exosome complex component RRP41
MTLIEDGKRLDGRGPDALRPIRIDAGPLHRADGSCYLEWGGNKIIAAVYGPKEAIPRHIQNPTRAVINAKYNMASFSVSDRKRPGPDRRSREISKITSEALENVILTEMFPRAMIDVNIEVLDADAGTRCAGLTAAAVALADAGIPMTDIPVSCAAGKVDDTVVLDLMGEEDQQGQADLPIAIAPRTEDILLLQMDGHMTVAEFDQALDLAMHGCRQISQMQKNALMQKYQTFEED